MKKTLLALATLLMMGAAVADESGCTDEDVVTLETPAGTYYVDNDQCQPDCLFSIWVYQESNGQEGLQRCDEYRDDCWNCTAESDTILF